ncbi:MAG: tandem-95 repeat protein, partial [Acidimicrobiia bacterium]|nr:tandem-95 repeat protein [Acidimicrobiia bacterium]
SHGTLSGTAPNLTYTPALNYNGSDSFTFKVNDWAVDSNESTVSITVTPVNDAPVAIDQSVSTAEDTAVAVTLAGSDVDGDGLTYSVLAVPTHGTLSGTAPNLTYTPAADYSGSDSFTFKVNDGAVDSNTATVSITVTAVNDAPVANNLSVFTAEDTAVAVTLTASDIDSGSLTYSVVGGPGHGTLSGTAPTLTYTPAANYFGPDSFTFKANDGTAGSNTATVFITVTPVTDAVLRYVGVSQMQSGGTAPLRVTVTSTDGGAVVGGTVTFAVAGNPGLDCAPTVQPLYANGALTSGTAFCNKTFNAVGNGTTFVVNATLTGTAGSVPMAGVLDPVASQRCPEGSANGAGTCNIAVFKGVQHTITGGGSLVLAASGGQYSANPGSKKNFGFNADSGKKGTSLKGDINIVYQYRVPANGALVDYQLKAMDISSVGKMEILGEIISSTGSLTDLSTSVVVVPQLVLQVRLTDGDDDSDPSTVDKVSYTAWHPTDGHLLFSTNWDSTLNIPRKQTLDGGNIDIK